MNTQNSCNHLHHALSVGPSVSQVKFLKIFKNFKKNFANAIYLDHNFAAAMLVIKSLVTHPSLIHYHVPDSEVFDVKW